MKTVIIAKVEYELKEKGDKIQVVAYYEEGLKYSVDWTFESRVELIDKLMNGPISKGKLTKIIQ